jgi:dsDNA-specific endonuclease/ATPase MutS2
MTDEDAHVVPIGPEFDLHSFAPRDIPDVVDAYLGEAHVAGFRQVRLVHGRGIGVQRARVHQVLDAHPLVTSFHDDPRSHLGATIVALRD